MASTNFGRNLNPYRKLRDPLGIKGARHSVVFTNNPSSIDQNQQLLVRFPNLGSYDVIVPGTARLAFTISLTSTDDNRTMVQNLGRVVVKKTTIKISGNEVLSIDDSDVFHCYLDLWKTTRERENAQYQGIDTIAEERHADTPRCCKRRSKCKVYRHQWRLGQPVLCPAGLRSALGDRLEYELTFNDYNRVIHAEDDSDASYSIVGISLEFDVVTQPELARMVRNQYTGQIAILYDRVLRHRKINKDKSDTLWNINLNVPARSMKGILMLFEANSSTFARDTESFYNPKIEKVEVTIEGIPNQLYSQGMRAYQQWDEARKFLAAGSERYPEVAAVAKDLALADVSLTDFLTTKYALWLDLRTSDDDRLHGSGRRVENASEGVTIQITKTAETAGALNIYLYVLMDAQLNIENSRFVSALY